MLASTSTRPALRSPLSAAIALSLALAIHELTTNAIKYGALSVEGGSVSVGWAVRREAEKRILSLAWREEGGPPVADAGRKGFGTRLLERVFNVKVSDVRTASIQGKWKRMGRFEGQRSDWKKAVITLAPGHKIELVEGA